MNYFNTINSIIKSKNFKRSDILEKIDKFHLYGNLSEEEAQELRGLVDIYSNADAERPTDLVIIKNLSEKIDRLTERIAILENKLAGTEIETPEVEIETWTVWDGISDKYQLGAIVEHNGVIYESVFNGQNVWEPGTIGTEALWKVKE